MLNEDFPPPVITNYHNKETEGADQICIENSFVSTSFLLSWE